MFDTCIYNNHRKEWMPTSNREIYLTLTQNNCEGNDLCNTSSCAIECDECDCKYDDKDIKEVIEKSNNKIIMKYTILHIKAFRKIENLVFNKTGKRFNFSDTHDLDKLFMYCFMERKEAHELHRKINKHHMKITEDLNDEIMIEEIIDHECARYTKPDKPMSSLDMNDNFFHCKKYEKICIELGLDQKNTKAISEKEFYKMADDITDDELLEWIKKSFKYMSSL